MPWDSRATALGPDIRRNGRDPRRFNGGFKKIGRAGRGLLARTARSGYRIRTTSTTTSTLGARHGERAETIQPRSQKAEAGENAKEGRCDVFGAARVRARRGKGFEEVTRRLSDELRFALTRRGRSGVGQVSVRKSTVPLASSAGIAMLLPGISS